MIFFRLLDWWINGRRRNREMDKLIKRSALGRFLSTSFSGTKYPRGGFE